MSAILKSGKFNVATAATSLKSLDDMGVFNYGGQQDNTNPGGPAISSATAADLGDSKAAQEMISSLESSIGSVSGKKAFSPIVGNLRSYNPWDTDVQSIQSQINATKQIVGKYLEGGVLRLEDEKKYEKILPKIGDTPEVAKAKVDQVKKLIQEKYASQTETLGQAGYDISGFSNKQNQNEIQNQLQSTPQQPQIKQPQPAQQPEQPPSQQINQDKEGIISRLLDATKQVIPELGKDVGERLKNIWNTAWDNAQQSKGRSIFENILRGQESDFQGVGQVAGAIGDVATRAMELAYKTGVPKETQEKIKQTATEFMQTEAGQTALLALQGGIEKWDEFKKSNPNVAKDMEAAFNIVTAIPAVKGLKVAGKGLKEAGAITSDVAELGARTLGKTGVENASKNIFKAVKPSITVDRNKKLIRETLNSANEELVKRGYKPTNLKEYAEQLNESRKEVWSEIESKLGAGKGTKINLQSIADELKSMASSPELVRTSKSTAEKIKKMAESLVSQGKEISVQDAEKLKQFINSELKGAFGKFNLSNAEQNAKKLITQKIGEQLDKVLSDIPGEFAGLKKKYGSLRQVEEDVLKRLIIFERQNPQGLVESFSKISGVGNILKGLMTASPSEIAKGAGEIALGQLQKRANDADVLVKNAFEKLSKRLGEFKPNSKLFNMAKDGKLKAGLSVEEVSGEEAKGYMRDYVYSGMKKALANMEARLKRAPNPEAMEKIEKNIEYLKGILSSIEKNLEPMNSLQDIAQQLKIKGFLK